jgi:rhamnogalacturonyl hydrolase YesR
LNPLLSPNALDDCGAMAAGMLKAQQAGIGGDLRWLSDIDLAYICEKQVRLPDGTLSRNRPLPNSIWLDDLYMSVPALAQMGRLTGDRRYFDDAVRQVVQFSERLFVKEKGLYMHGWIQGMQEHPQFHWGRANGWAAMATVELLSVLPEDHPGRSAVLELFREHARGLVAVQGKNGLWHQLLDRPDTFEETSASAMFVFAIARGINRGWLDALAYGPMVSVGWNALVQKVNAQGQVEGTCVGTGLGWEPVFYAYRPTSVYAAHGYGPMLLAGSEMITLRRGKGAAAGINDGALHFGKTPGLK